MMPFYRQNQHLMCDGVRLTDVATTHGTPTFVYSAHHILERYNALNKAFRDLDTKICYAVKANSNQAILTMLRHAGAGADVVSIGEYRRAIRAGFHPASIVFAGVGKTQNEMAEALAGGLMQFNVESLAELEALNSVAGRIGKTAPIALRLNPDVDAKTHAKITTGKAENKFGISLEIAQNLGHRWNAFPNVCLESLAIHIGSQLTDLEPYRQAYGILETTARDFLALGHDLKRLDIGGGLGVTYATETEPNLQNYAKIVRDIFEPLGLPLVLEPGRYLVARAGGLLTRALYVKESHKKRFVVVDAAMNDLIRPTLYDAHHQIRLTNDQIHTLPTDVVGPVCETGDVLAVNRKLPVVNSGDLMLIEGSGAYAAVMGSTYNTRALPAEVLVRENRFDVIRARQNLNDLIDQDRVPADLEHV